MVSAKFKSVVCDHFSLKENTQIQAVYCYKRPLKSFSITDVLPLFLKCKRCFLCCKILANQLSIKMRAHDMDAGRDEK